MRLRTSIFGLCLALACAATLARAQEVEFGNLLSTGKRLPFKKQSQSVDFVVPKNGCEALSDKRRRCRRTPGCAWEKTQIARGEKPKFECVATPPPPTGSVCYGARRRKCMHKDPYSSFCNWNAETKTCDERPLCQSWENTTFTGNRGGGIYATMIATINYCVPDCVDNPLNQFLPRSADAGLPIDDAWTGWDVDLNRAYDRDEWCPLVYGDELAGKEAVNGMWTTDMVGVARDCDDNHNGPSAFFTNWVWSWNADLGAHFNGNRWCCETCDTCNTEKFRCATPDPEKGAYPCGSDAWGLLNPDGCYTVGAATD